MASTDNLVLICKGMLSTKTQCHVTSGTVGQDGFGPRKLIRVEGSYMTLCVVPVYDDPTYQTVDYRVASKDKKRVDGCEFMRTRSRGWVLEVPKPSKPGGQAHGKVTHNWGVEPRGSISVFNNAQLGKGAVVQMGNISCGGGFSFSSSGGGKARRDPFTVWLRVPADWDIQLLPGCKKVEVKIGQCALEDAPDIGPSPSAATSTSGVQVAANPREKDDDDDSSDDDHQDNNQANGNGQAMHIRQSAGPSGQC
jgi:hypothetical protein